MYIVLSGHSYNVTLMYLKRSNIRRVEFCELIPSVLNGLTALFFIFFYFLYIFTVVLIN
jgi:hypothetical protein